MKAQVLRSLLLCSAWMACGNLAAQVPRTDSASCALPGGHRVELRSRYLWVPVNPHPNSDRSHFDQGTYKVRLLPRSGKALDLQSWHDGQAMDESVARRFCAEYGARDPLVFGQDDLVLLPRRQSLSTEGLRILAMASSQSERSPVHQALLREHGLAFPVGWSYALGLHGELIAEQALLSTERKGLITAVLRFESRDLGKTWSETGLFETSSLFQLGKSWEEQDFIGHAAQVNGKRLRTR